MAPELMPLLRSLRASLATRSKDISLLTELTIRSTAPEPWRIRNSYRIDQPLSPRDRTFQIRHLPVQLHLVNRVEYFLKLGPGF